MDNKGSATIEITIVLIVIIMIVGIIATSNEIMTNKLSNSVEDENIEHLLSETADYLINNPGNPENWEEYEDGLIGLAILNEEGKTIPNSISYSKFLLVGKLYDKLVNEKLLDSKIKTSMELVPQETSISSVKIGDKNPSDNVYSVNRLVKCDFLKKYVIKDFQNEGKCNHNHDQEDYSCNYFKIFKGNLRSSDYYLIVDSSQVNKLKWSMDDTKSKNHIQQKVDGESIYLNHRIDQMFGEDSSEVIFIHFDKKDAKAVLISLPKYYDSSKLKYDYYITNTCQFILKGWY